MRAWWYLLRPKHHGALVAVWVDDRVLILRQSYRPHLSLPGGGVRRGERPIDAALRELREEVGLTLPESALSIAWEGTHFWDWRHDHVTIFEARLDSVPPVRVDGREIVEARLISPLAVLAGPRAPFVEGYLLRALSRK
jgi:8-oxo-dGTP pyrophosphatase MutT (NUDIX family)